MRNLRAIRIVGANATTGLRFDRWSEFSDFRSISVWLSLYRNAARLPDDLLHDWFLVLWRPLSIFHGPPQTTSDHHEQVSALDVVVESAEAKAARNPARYTSEWPGTRGSTKREPSEIPMDSEGFQHAPANRYPLEDSNSQTLTPDAAVTSEVLHVVGAAECGAVGVQGGAVDSDLQGLIDAWSNLPDAVRSEILKLVHYSVSVSTTS